MLKKYGMYLVVAVLFIIALGLIYYKLNPETLAKNLIAGTGKMDGDLIALNTKYPGRLDSVTVHEGQQIKKGDIIATLKSDEYLAKKEALTQNIQAAKKALDATRQEYLIAKDSLPLNVKNAFDALKIAQSRQKSLHDSINTTKAVVAQNKRDLQRVTTLYNKKLIGKQKYELTKLELTHNHNKLLSLEQTLIQTQKNISIAKNTLQQAKYQMKKITALQATLEAAQKKIDALQANKKELQIIIDELTIRSPINGVVIEKIAHPGEVLSSGMIVATLLDPSTLYLKLFIDTMENGKIKVGDKAVIFLDSNPDKPMKATVIRIADKAEFTPKDVSVRSDRIQRVYAVHLKPLKENTLLKIGIPAIGIISTDGKGLPNSLSEIPEI
ncbi:HlyD family secretion protein [Sulfurospirillum sp. 1612]|uniref:HlyD family secretion protein n=1 Tax=Sulfurospirillum sp. 1612 TaxID=3094835 RepID=UPI002F9358E6